MNKEIILEKTKWFPDMIKVGKFPEVGKVFSSDEIKNDFIITLQQSEIFKKNPKPLEGVKKLIEKGVIIPAQKTRTIVGYFFARWPLKQPHLYIMGTHMLHKNDVIIFIFLDSHFLSYGLYNPEEVVKTLIHELAHNYAYSAPKSYYQNHVSDLRKFYNTYFSIYFDYPVKNIKKDKMTEFLLVLMHLERHGFEREYLEKYGMLIYDFSRMGNDGVDRDDKLFAYYKAMHYFLKYRFVYYKDPVVQAIYSAYNKVFKIPLQKINSLCIQELIYSSEVLAILSEHRYEKSIFDYLSKIK